MRSQTSKPIATTDSLVDLARWLRFWFLVNHRSKRWP
jgi:hypothetical protein